MTDNKYGFLFKKSLLPKNDLNSLLEIKEFISMADAIIADGKGIEDIDIYRIVKVLYFPKLYSGERSGNAVRLSKATRRFSEKLFGSDENWKKAYEEYKQNL